MTGRTIANEDEKRILRSRYGSGACPSGPIWLLCPFTPKSGRAWGPESAAKLRTSRDDDSQGGDIFEKGTAMVRVRRKPAAASIKNCSSAFYE
jgi:hypothetical protein